MSDGDGLVIDANVGEEEPEARPRGFWSKLRRGLGKTHDGLRERISAAVGDRGVIDEETLEGLEEALIAADLGVETAMELVENLRADTRPFEARDEVRLRQRLVDEMAVLLLDAPRPSPLAAGPVVTLVVGVNGAGKTTSIGKLARHLKTQGMKIMLAAGDTFRAAAVEQLQIWGQRNDVTVVAQATGADSAAVAFDALQAARARGADVLIADTAGRLHTQSNLMDELKKVKRVMGRVDARAPHEVLLVLDASQGQNALQQARLFHEALGVTGIVLTKLDGTAKGGIVLAIEADLGIPVKLVGVGESPDDLISFDPAEFVDALFG